MQENSASITEQYNSGIDYQITSKYDLKYNYDRCIQFESQKQSTVGTANMVNNHIALDLETQALQALLPKIQYETMKHQMLNLKKTSSKVNQTTYGILWITNDFENCTDFVEQHFDVNFSRTINISYQICKYRTKFTSCINYPGLF